MCLQQGGGTIRCIVGVKCTQYGQSNFGTSPKSKLNTLVICLKIQFAALSMSVGIKIEELYAAVIGQNGRSSAAAAWCAAAATDSGRHAAFVHIRLKLFLGIVKIL